MTITTTVPAPVRITRRRLTGLLAVVTTASAAVTWTVTTTALDNAAEPARVAASTRHAVVDNSLGLRLAAAAGERVAAATASIVVADAYHGAGVLLCSSGQQQVA